MPADLTVGDEVTTGGLTWRYTGQVTYSADPHPLRGPLSYTVTNDPDQPLIERLQSVTRDDLYGSSWDLVAVDPAILSFDTGSVGDTNQTDLPGGADEDGAVGDVVSWWPFSMQNYDCTNDGEYDLALWDGESRSFVGNPVGRQTAVIMVSAGLSGSCTGTLLKPRWVLTAAHCMFDNNGNLIDLQDVYVWDYDNGNTDYAYPDGRARFRFDPTANSDPEHDIAILHLADELDAWSHDDYAYVLGQRLGPESGGRSLPQSRISTAADRELRQQRLRPLSLVKQRHHLQG